MSNKKRIQKKIQSIDNKKWFREVSFIINKGFPNLSLQTDLIAKSFFDTIHAINTFSNNIIIAMSAIPDIKILSDNKFQNAYFQGQKAAEKYLEFYKGKDLRMENTDALLKHPDGVSFNLSSLTAESNKTLN
ncbi:hypothetical protein [Elizabethkingia ursingii]|uniref:Uncharacterized protein n=1 Tax=Elizabethkingia ursingii TaxID=1756150 RepID=A0AAJ3TNP4_9FLAO|nr:hypothetical protein [Elizabethkingia ursingii]AQX08045.1 hypothetical protein BBD34_05020 [Elizabethkingia ursingii]OPB73601.1 hypothetical protein BAY32_11200 [Elizabethkingia ursingii]